MRGIGIDPQFFVKLHRTKHPHYDFRLEHAGVLKSWVVPLGPCLDPTERRQALYWDDHEVKYGSLERVIPSGRYGAGPVLLWDHGIWLPCQDVDQALRDGRLEFQLRGSKLNGFWLLTRMPDQLGVERENWLLIKEWDAEARSLSEMDIVVEMPKSVLTGRTVDQVAAEPHRFESLKRKKKGPAPNQRLLFPDDPEP